MADDKQDQDNDEEEDDSGALTGSEDKADESGIGNLPPLSDFDSAEGDSDGGLPPMESASKDDAGSGISGLPPIVDIKVDTPAVRPSDLDTPEPQKADLESPGGFNTPASELDTPDPAQGLGFQDFSADSDFSPETPEIGPGPDSDIETPMFDSAFGGDSDDFATTGTSAPTQAMETPMFDTSDTPSSGRGFDNDAFGVPTPDVGGESGTPIPDFSPDTGMPQEAVGVGGKGKRQKSGIGGGKFAFTVILVLVIGLAVGIAANPFIADNLDFLPNKYKDDIADKEIEIAGLNSEVRSLKDRLTSDPNLSEAAIAEMTARYDNLKQLLEQTGNDYDAALRETQEKEQLLAQIREDLDENNDAYVTAADELEALQNEIFITDARHEGLTAENERLTEQVGELEEANARRQSTLDTLLHNVDLLTIQIQGGSPLTPERHAHQDRLDKAAALHDKVANAKWVNPQLLNEYTDLYLSELNIASSTEYFFARIPIRDALNVEYFRWAECLMNGNWSVYFRTLDGKHVGSYENTAGSGAPKYEFREQLPSGMKSDIEDAITSSRVEGYEDKIVVLKNKEAIYESKTKLQRKFSSL